MYLAIPAAELVAVSPSPLTEGHTHDILPHIGYIEVNYPPIKRSLIFICFMEFRMTRYIMHELGKIITSVI